MPINRPGDLAALAGLSHLDDPLRRQLYRVRDRERRTGFA